MTKRLRQIKKELGFTEGPGLIYGYYSDYLVTFSQMDKELELFVDAELDESDEEMLDKLRLFLKANAPAYNLTGSSFSNTGISVRVSTKESEALLEFFFIFMNQLKLLHVPGAAYCANCGGEIGDDHVLLKIGSHVHTCDEPCAQKIVSSGKAKAAGKTSKRVLPGILGALLIGLLGAVPYIFLGYKGYTCAPAAFLIPLAVAFGFYLFGGKPGMGKLLTCILLPLVLFAVAAAGLLGLSVYQDWALNGYVFTMGELIEAIRTTFLGNEAFREAFLYRQVLFGGIFLLAGYVFTLPTAYAKPDPYFMTLKEPKSA